MKQGFWPQIALGRASFVASVFLVGSAGMAIADTCLPPSRPYLPEDQSALREYADLIRQDFETYVTEISGYFRCLDAERARVFSEAQDVTRDYQTLVETVSQD